MNILELFILGLFLTCAVITGALLFLIFSSVVSVALVGEYIIDKTSMMIS